MYVCRATSVRSHFCEFIHCSHCHTEGVSVIKKIRRINKRALEKPQKFHFGYLLSSILGIIGMGRCFKCLLILSLYICDTLHEAYNFNKSNTPPRRSVFHIFLYCTNDTKSRKVSHLCIFKLPIAKTRSFS